MDVAAVSLQDCAHEGDGRALAVGAGDVDDGRQMPLRVAEPIKNAPHALKRKVDPLGVQREQPRNDIVVRAHVESRVRARWPRSERLVKLTPARARRPGWLAAAGLVFAAPAAP